MPYLLVLQHWSQGKQLFTCCMWKILLWRNTFNVVKLLAACPNKMRKFNVIVLITYALIPSNTIVSRQKSWTSVVGPSTVYRLWAHMPKIRVLTVLSDAQMHQLLRWVFPMYINGISPSNFYGPFTSDVSYFKVWTHVIWHDVFH